MHHHAAERIRNAIVLLFHLFGGLDVVVRHDVFGAGTGAGAVKVLVC